MKQKDLKGKENALTVARKYIMIASTLTYGSASGVEPFVLSKCLNIMGKTLADFRLILSVMLDEVKREDVVFEMDVSPTVQLFESYRTSCQKVIKDE